MKDITVRKANRKDIQTLVELNRKLFEFEATDDSTLDMSWPAQKGTTYFKGRISANNSIGLIAEKNGTPVGYLVGALTTPADYRLPFKLAELENMFILEEFRHLGIGSALVQEFITWCKERAVQRIKVVATASNTSALRFYKSAGFNDSTVSLEMPL